MSQVEIWGCYLYPIQPHCLDCRPLFARVYNDLQLFGKGLHQKLEPYERWMGDCPWYVCCLQGITCRPQQSRMQIRLRMRHEQINERMQSFNGLVLCYTNCSICTPLSHIYLHMFHDTYHTQHNIINYLLFTHRIYNFHLIQSHSKNLSIINWLLVFWST